MHTEHSRVYIRVHAFGVDVFRLNDPKARNFAWKVWNTVTLNARVDEHTIYYKTQTLRTYSTATIAYNNCNDDALRYRIQQPNCNTNHWLNATHWLRKNDQYGKPKNKKSTNARVRQWKQNTIEPVSIRKTLTLPATKRTNNAHAERTLHTHACPILLPIAHNTASA